MILLPTAFDTWTVFIALICVLITYWTFQIVKRRRKYKLPPGPTGIPFFGNIGAINHLTLWDHRDKYGDISYINILGTNIIVLNSVEIIKDAFQNPLTAKVFNDRPPTFVKRFIVYDDIVLRSIKAKGWKQQRQLLHSLLRQYGEGKIELERIVGQELNVVINLLENDIGKETDIGDYIEPSILNILDILLLCERNDYDHLKITESRAAMRYGNRISSPFVDTILNKIPVIRFMPFEIGRMYREIIRVRDKHFKYMFDKCRNCPEDDNKSKTGLMYELFRLRGRHEWITEDTIKGSVQDINIAGYLTTRCSLYALFLILLHYPDVQTKIQQEIDEVVGHERQPNVDDQHQMPYTQAAILELLRFSSVLPVSLPHACAEDTEFRGYTIPKNSIILPNLFRVHHDPNVWDSPWRFEPGRFIDSSGNLVRATHPIRQNMIAFGVGKRMCMGEVFAKTRIFLYITYLLQVFYFKPADYVPSCDPRDFVDDLILNPASYKLRIERRQ